MADDDPGSGLRAGAPQSCMGQSLMGLATILLIALAATLSLYRLRPPGAVPSSAPAQEFSSARALEHLKVIAEKPHQTGSAEHSRVRDYIVGQLMTGGLKAEIQRATAVVPTQSGDVKAGTVENIIARLGGNANSKAVLLVAHYDSMPTSFGASDDGSGVVALLETLRALRAGPALKNDVIFLFTDAEEQGLLGAQAFVQEHPSAKDVGLVLNFEARGVSGPSIMFETSEQNSWLIKEFARAAPYPITNSLAFEVYRLLPNDTDFTVFKRAGLPGFNFAYIGDSTHYHTRLDNLNEIDERSLQHHGSYALALTRHFGNSDLQNSATGNSIYFDFLRLFLLRYPAALAFPITLIIAALFIWMVFMGLKKGRLTLAGIALGALAFLACLILTPLAMSLLGWAVRQAEGALYQSGLFFAGFAALTIGFIALLYVALRRKVGLENLTVGALTWWLILLTLASLFLPGASYLLAWPLLFALPALAHMLIAKDGPAFSCRFLFLLWLAAIPGVMLLVPTIQQIFVGLGLNAVGIVMAILVLLLGLLIPHLKLVTLYRERLFPAASAFIGLGLIVVGALTSGYDARHPKPDTLFYGLNADAGRAVWASFDRKTDRWTSLFLPASAQRKPLPELFSSNTQRAFLQSPAPIAQLATPEVELLENSLKEGSRVVRLRVTSPRGAAMVLISLETPATDVQALAVNGKRIEGTPASRQRATQWNVSYYNPPAEGIELALELRTQGQVKLRVVDQSYGFPDLGGKTMESRPSDIMPAPYPFNDSTFVSKSFTF